MSRWVVVSDAVPSEELLEELRSAGARCSAGADVEGSMGGRGATADVEAESAPVLGDFDADIVALDPIASHTAEMTGPRVKRTLLLTVREGTPDEVVKRFEADTMLMPEHISTIRSWALSRVDPSRSMSSKPWTHVWEQEFENVEGLMGEYLLHPYHWTYVDRWFDAEIADSIVEPDIAHLFRWVEGAVL